MTSPWENKIIALEEMHDFLLSFKGAKLVVVNGCFDVVHIGHLQLLYEAKRQGDILICALNDDAYVRKFKGVKRPIHPLSYRQKMVAGLGYVDVVTSFEEETPEKVLRLIKPHIYVNGSDYGESACEREIVQAWGGEVHIVSLLQDFSSSKMVKKIQNI